MTVATKVILALVIVAALGIGGYAAFHKSGASTAKQTTSTTTTKSSNTSASSETTNPSANVAATINFSDSGFSPAVTTVKVGDTVQITNTSSQVLQFDSDPHPVHSDEPELNVGTVAAGQSKTFTVTKAGHWGFHDHLNPSMTGTLDVE